MNYQLFLNIFIFPGIGNEYPGRPFLLHILLFGRPLLGLNGQVKLNKKFYFLRS